MSIVRILSNKQLITPPEFVINGIQYETMMGSVAYGVSDVTSDVDIYGFCIQAREDVFPHLKGEILGFGRQHQRFEQYQQHHVLSPDNQKNYDITVYSIVKYFQLCMENNPNMIDSLFVPDRCILFRTKIANMIRDERKLFLHKGAWHKFKGYSYSQLHKMDSKNPVGKRKEMVEKYGYDVKFAYHLVRLLNEVEQILVEGDLDLERNREQLKDIRRGNWKQEDIRNWFDQKERDLEKLYIESKLQHSPDEGKIKTLLLNCLEEYYGSLDKCIQTKTGKYLLAEDFGSEGWGLTEFKTLDEIQKFIQSGIYTQWKVLKELNIKIIEED